jgi:uncharacterized protein
MTIFWENPIQTSAFFALLMSFLSLWIHRSAWLWGSFFIIAGILAYHTGILQIAGIIPIGTLLIIEGILKKQSAGITRILLFLAAVLISWFLLRHTLPGFHNWKIMDAVCIGNSYIPYSLWLNFDKPFIGLFVLAWMIPLISTKNQFKVLLKKTLPLAALGIIILMFLAVYKGGISADLKLPNFLIPWMIINLFFTVIPEEAFFRGFVQQELFDRISHKPTAHVVSVIVASLFFAAAHIHWISSIPFLFMVFIAGVIYGTIYQITKSIESAIFTHFALNLVHFIFFTYPA